MASAVALILGLVAGYFVPSEAMLGASAELIAFVSLIMAGLLPAMILTATAIRGDSFSTARVKDYGEGLRRQLRFWAVLFLVALIAVLSICVAKGASETASVGFSPASIASSSSAIVRTALMVAFASLAIVLARLYPAFTGLRSLLDLTVRMAEAQALANDRSFGDALSTKAARIAATAQPLPMADWPE